MIRLALLTAQRREKVASMRWADVSVDGVWTVPADAREKGTGGALELPNAALEIVRAQPRMGDNPHVFAGRGDGASMASLPRKEHSTSEHRLSRGRYTI